jgi:hypothetical protein
MHARRTIFAAVAAALVVTALGTGCGGSGGVDITVDGPVNLTRSFTEGRTINYDFKLGSQSGVKLTAYEQTVYTQTELRTRNTFVEVTPDEVKMQMLINHAAGSMTVGDNVMVDEAVSGLRAKELEFTIAPDGKIMSWSGLGSSEYLEAGAGQLAVLLYDVFPPLPDGPMGVGTTWTTDYDVPDLSAAVNRDFLGQTKFTVTGFKRKFLVDCVVVHRVTEFTFEGRAEQEGQVWLMDGDGNIEGDSYLALEDGMLVYSSAEMNLTLVGEGSSVAGAAASDVVEMGIAASMVIELGE